MGRVSLTYQTYQTYPTPVSVRAQRAHRIDRRRAPRGRETRQRRHDRQRDGDRNIGRRIGRLDGEEQASHDPRQHQCADDAQHEPRGDRTETLTEDHPDDTGSRSAECHPYADFRRPLIHEEGHDTGDAGRGDH